MELTGQIKEIKATEFFGTKNFPKRKLMLDRSQKEQFGDRVYPNFNEITFIGEERAKLPDDFSEGDIVKITVNVFGNYFQHEGVEKFSQELQGRQIVLLKKAEPNEEKNANYPM